MDHDVVGSCFELILVQMGMSSQHQFSLVVEWLFPALGSRGFSHPCVTLREKNMTSSRKSAESKEHQSLTQYICKILHKF